MGELSYDSHRGGPLNFKEEELRLNLGCPFFIGQRLLVNWLLILSLGLLDKQYFGVPLAMVDSVLLQVMRVDLEAR